MSTFKMVATNIRNAGHLLEQAGAHLDQAAFLPEPFLKGFTLMANRRQRRSLDYMVTSCYHLLRNAVAGFGSITIHKLDPRLIRRHLRPSKFHLRGLHAV